LADTVVDATAETIGDRTATGFVFENAGMPELISAIGRALALYREPLTWRRLQLHAMAQDFSWDASAAQYASLYNDVSGVPCMPVTDEALAENVSQETVRQIAS
jgi:starch synthase